MLQRCAVFLLFSALVLAQSASNELTPTSPTAPSAAVGPSDPVIILEGFCAKPVVGTDCKTTVSRTDFEKLTTALNPAATTMPMAAKQNLATEYAKMLVFAAEAEKRGLGKSPRVEEVLRFVRLQILSQDLMQEIKREAEPSPEQIQAFYKENQNKFVELSLKRIFIPKMRPESKDGKPLDEVALKASAEKIHNRAAAGEDFDKLQKEVYDAAGLKTPAPPTSIPAWRRDAVPPGQQEIFNLNPGDLSRTIEEKTGYYIYRIETKRLIPIDQVKAEITTSLSSDNVQAKMNAMTSHITPRLNDAYFGHGSGQNPELPPPAPVSGPPNSDGPPATISK